MPEDRDDITAETLPEAARAALGALFGTGGDAARASEDRLREGERRYVSVVFADISGFTALSERMDPEDLRDLINDCFAVLVERVRRYGGVVDKYIGDCIMALFGAPVAHEDDAERAVLATLEMRQALTEFAARRGVQLQLHCGINTGEVLAGAVGADQTSQYTVLGDTVNTASRLESASKAGEILAGHTTWLLSRHAVQYTAVAPLTLKGKAQPVPAYLAEAALLRAGTLRGFAGRETPLVGRGAERQAMRASLERLHAGQGGVVAVTGEAGFGKSRLVGELRGQVQGAKPALSAAEGCKVQSADGADARGEGARQDQQDQEEVQWLEGRCLSYGAEIPFWLVQDLVRDLCGIDTGDDAASMRTKIEREVQRSVGGGEGDGATGRAGEGGDEGARDAQMAARPLARQASSGGARPGVSPLRPLQPAGRPTGLSPLSPHAAARPTTMAPLRPLTAARPAAIAPLSPLSAATQPSALSPQPSALSAPARTAGALEPEETAALLRHILGLPVGHAFVETLEPEVRQRLAVRAATGVLVARARSGPMVLVADDLHWADALSLQVVDDLVRHTTKLPLLLVLVHRPDFDRQWPAEASVERIDLHRLPPVQMAELAAVLLTEAADAAVIEPLVERADGNPFFLEELVKSVLEAAIEADAAGSAAGAGDGRTTPAHTVQLPPTIHAVLMARIDRLDEAARRALQAAAVIGRQFAYRVLAWLAEADAQLSRDIEAHLAELERRRLVRQERREAGQREYRFDQAITQEVAYQSLLRRRRRLYHQRVAEALMALFPSRQGEFMELLAYHFYEGGAHPQAARCCLRAAAKACLTFANEQALRQYERALAAAEAWRGRAAGQTAADGAESDDGLSPTAALVQAHEGLGDVYQLIGKLDTALEHFQTGWDLLESAGTTAGGRAVAYWRGDLARKLGRVYELHGEWPQAEAWWQQGLASIDSALALARRAAELGVGDDTALVEPLELARLYFDAAAGFWRRGDLDGASTWCDQGLAIVDQYDPATAWREVLRGRQVAAAISSRQGQHQEAEAPLLEALDLAERMSDAGSTASICNNLAIALVYLGRWGEARTFYERSLALREKMGDERGVGLVANNLGTLELRLGDFAAAEAHLAQAEAVWQSLGHPYGVALAQTNRGLVRLAAGDVDTATTFLEQSLELALANEVHERLPETYRALAEARLAAGDVTGGLELAQAAMEAAEAARVQVDAAQARVVLARGLVLEAHHGDTETRRHGEERARGREGDAEEEPGEMFAGAIEELGQLGALYEAAQAELVWGSLLVDPRYALAAAKGAVTVADSLSQVQSEKCKVQSEEACGFHRGTGLVAEGRRLLERAADTFVQLGARHDAARAWDVLDRAG